MHPFDCDVNPILDRDGLVCPEKLIPEKSFCHSSIIYVLEVEGVSCLVNVIKHHL